MRAIEKGAEPQTLVQHRCSASANYDNYNDKDTLRQHLLSEQRGLCCYCMSRIEASASNMKIEHWHCKGRYCAKQLNYRNLLAACRGGEGKPRAHQTCDTRKGSEDLKWNPAAPEHQVEMHIRYEIDGTIRSSDSEFDAQLNEILNLNISFLKNNRKQVLDAIIVWWKDQKNRLHGPIPRTKIQAKLTKFTRSSGDLPTYSRVTAWWLEQKLARMKP